MDLKKVITRCLTPKSRRGLKLVILAICVVIIPSWIMAAVLFYLSRRL